MLLTLLIGLGALIAGYVIFNSVVARFSKVGRLAAKFRRTSDDAARRLLVEQMAGIGKSASMSGDAALVHLAVLGLGDGNKDIKGIAHEPKNGS